MHARRLVAALALAVSFSFALPRAQAQTVYACQRDGVHVYQDRACGAGQRELQLSDAGPSAQPEPVQAMLDAWNARVAARRQRPRVPVTAPRESRSGRAGSWRCSAANGEVFYAHTRCPGAIVARASAALERGKAARYSVRAEPVSRRDACREMRRAGASVRRGHERDAVADPYERNLGRDPCS